MKSDVRARSDDGTVGRSKSWSAIDLSNGLPTGDEKGAAVQSMFDAISGRYDLVNRIMTFRMDVGWRRKAVSALGVDRGSLVLDIATGTGDLCVDLASAGMIPVGVDFSFGMLHNARTSAPLIQGDALGLPLRSASVDAVTCGFALRNFVDLQRFFNEVGRVVRPGGRIAFLDATTPPNPILRLGHGLYFGKVVPAIGGLLSDKSAYRYLPKSLGYMPDPSTLLDMVRSAGFSTVQRRLLHGGIAHLITGTRAG